MSNRYDRLIDRLSHTRMKRDEFMNAICAVAGLYVDTESEYELLKISGLPLVERDGYIGFSTSETPYKEQRFCIVDVETNGSLPQKDQAIELGAILYQNGEIIDRFESFIYSKDVPEYITKITGITQDMLKDAPSMRDVLAHFRLFLSDSVFVAHNASFDYSFLSAMMRRVQLPIIKNRRLCTIDLARKTIVSERYGLSFLNEFLGINTAVSHRAYADALTALRVFEESLRHVPDDVVSTEDLIHFSSPKDMQNRSKSKRTQRMIL
ncbi:MAG: 3'-5' exonuclease [Wolinella sp.]